MDTSQVVSPKPHKESERFYVDYNPWVEYTATTTAGGAPNFKRIRLFYSHAADSSFVKVSYDGSPFVVRYLNNQSGVQMLDLSPAVSCKKFVWNSVLMTLCTFMELVLMNLRVLI